ncbi:hypothetical protein [Hafnia sp. HMSC23F03]|uniref:hypothetical protein n=1 Tax=Hafnia sp. HMSC23F03 TaxID=1581059 RepID=UPI0008B46382|nr:hypothetical protein [Hafnia sp. HMSC23F03]OFS11052.1 hypothetical protein HMPREF3091_07620 [Hafnia sp. HMSC23F03]
MTKTNQDVIKRYDEIYSFYLKSVSIINYDFYKNQLIRIPVKGKRDFENASLEKKDLYANLMFENLSQEYLDGFIDASHKNQRCDNQYLCDFLAMKIMEILIVYIHTGEPRPYLEGADKIGLSLLTLLACKQFDVVERLYEELINSITNGTAKKSITHGESSPEVQKLFVLAVEMLASERKQTVDWAAAGIPVERFYLDFVREALYSRDDEVLNKWLTALCDQHLKWCSRFPAVPAEAFGYDIPIWMGLWPFEYQAVRNFRAKHGLDTPEIEHPLINTVFARMPEPDFSQWQKPDWFEDFCANLFEVNPDISFVRDIFFMKKS